MELGIDLQYLLFLQNLRLATGGIFDEFFNGMSKVAVDVLPFLPFLIFLCVSKKWGYRILTSYLGADLLNGVVRLFFPERTHRIGFFPLWKCRREPME